MPARTIGTPARSHPAPSTTALMPTNERGVIPCCNSSLRAPLVRSLAIARMATKGRRKDAAISYALKVGATTPSSGNSASASPAAVPPFPLASAYERTALMKDTPTSGPIIASMTHHERELISSRHSFFRSHFHALLREGKEDLLEIRWQAVARTLARKRDEHVKGALGDNTAAAQEHEAVADLRRIGDLVDGQEERAIRRKMLTQRGSRFAALAQVETFKRFVDQEYRLRGEQPECKQGAFALPFGQGADRHTHQWRQGEIDNYLLVY